MDYQKLFESDISMDAVKAWKAKVKAGAEETKAWGAKLKAGEDKVVILTDELKKR